MRSLALAGALVAASLAGCIGASVPQEAAGPGGDAFVASAPVRVLDDPAGDATDLPRGTGTCEGRPPVGNPRPPPPAPPIPSVIPPMLPIPDGAKAACRDVTARVVPAPPALDVTGVDFAEDADALVVTLEVAALEEDFQGVFEHHEYLIYQVRWKNPAVSADVSGAFETVRLFVFYGPDGQIHTERDFRYGLDRDGGPCSDWAVCLYDPAAAIVPGTPGSIRWTIPRGILPLGGLGDSLDGIEFRTTRLPRTDASPIEVARSPVGSTGLAAPLGVLAYAVDGTLDTGAFTFTTPASGHLPPPPAYRVDPASDTWGDRAQPEVDLIGAGLIERSDTLTLALHVQRVAESGADLHVEFEIGIPGARIYGADVHPHDNGRIDWSSWCENDDCTREIAVPIVSTFVAGEPGWLNFTFARSDLASPLAGHVPAFVEVEIYDVVKLRDGEEFYLADSTYDYFEFPAMRFAFDSASHASLDVVPLLAQDVPGDAGEIGLLGYGNRLGYDITYLAAEAESDTSTLLSLGVVNLSSLAPPLGDDAALYAAALETTAGRSLVGYHHAADAEAGEFFCAEDTLLLVEDAPAVPPRHLWTPIEGSVSTRGDKSDRASAGSGAAGSLVFHVPHACLGLAQAGPVDVQRAAAGTFVITKTGDTRLVDRVEHDAPARIAFAAVSAASPWYVSPFGLASFWDMAGVLGAVAVSGVGVAVVQRRRRALKRYLADVERVERAFPDDPVRRERGLAEIRGRLKEDLVRNRIHEGHFVIVERRVDAAIAQARAETFSETFKDLPHWFVVKLQKLLSDGVLSSEDYRVLAAMVEATDLPAATKAKVRGRLAGWVSVESVDAGAP